MLRLVVKGFSAPNAVGNCARNAAVHAQVLQRYDIGKITSAKAGWWDNAQTFVLLLEHAETHEPFGTVRLQRWGNGRALPLESALADVDCRVHSWVARFSDRGVGELCGLWSSPRLKGFGMGAVLTRMGLSLATQVGVSTILGVCDTRAVASNVGLGFARDPLLASEGSFEYPRPGLFAHVLRVPNAARLDGATIDNRAAVNEYREAPTGSEIIEGARGSLMLERDLRIAPLSGATPARARLSVRPQLFPALLQLTEDRS